MPDSATLAAFVAAAAVLIAVPGPDMLFLIAQGSVYGRTAGIAAGLGLAAGNLVHTGLVTAGAAALFRALPDALETLQIAGVAYLLWLAATTAQAESRDAAIPGPRGAAASTNAGHEPTMAAVFRRGLLLNVLNPKVVLFFLAFLPLFADAERGPVWMQVAALGTLFAAMVATAYCPLGAVAGVVGTYIRRAGRRAGRLSRWALVVLYVALAARLALEGM